MNTDKPKTKKLNLQLPMGRDFTTASHDIDFYLVEFKCSEIMVLVLSASPRCAYFW